MYCGFSLEGKRENFNNIFIFRKLRSMENIALTHILINTFIHKSGETIYKVCSRKQGKI